VTYLCTFGQQGNFGQDITCVFRMLCGRAGCHVGAVGCCLSLLFCFGVAWMSARQAEMFSLREECSDLMLGQHRIFPLPVAFGFKVQSQQYVLA